MSSAIPKRWR
uniref:Uncharacterized protein n=1 Tax=Lepeophtheirus salmonis TaxID=72036 RepID=A0A0K2U5J2_LEPSM